MTDRPKTPKAATPASSAFEQARAKMTDAERALVEAHAKLAAITTELEALTGEEQAMRARHVAALTAPGKGNPVTPGKAREIRERIQGLREDAEIVRANLVLPAEKALVQAEEEAADRLQEEWDQIALAAEAELIEVITRIGNKAWRAQIATGRHIDFPGYVRRCAQEAESALIAQGGGDGIFYAPTGVDLPEVLERSALIDREIREKHRHALRRAVMPT